MRWRTALFERSWFTQRVEGKTEGVQGSDLSFFVALFPSDAQGFLGQISRLEGLGLDERVRLLCELHGFRRAASVICS